MDEERRDELEEKQEEAKEERKEEEHVVEDKPSHVKVHHESPKHHDFNSKPKFDKDKILETVRGNPWIVSTFVMGAIVMVLLFSSGGLTGGVISADAAGDIIIDLAKAQLPDIEIVNVEKEDGLYKIDYSSSQGDSFIYLTLDGKNIANPLAPQEDAGEDEQPIEFTEEQNVLVKEFSSCLYEKGMRVYYAGWCSHCHNLIETFGGLENAGNMMIECQTETQEPGKDAALCEVEDIQGFPTIKINGEAYNGARTFEAFAETTGCVVPQLN